MPEKHSRPPPIPAQALRVTPPAPAGARVAGQDRRRLARVATLVCPGLGHLLSGRWMAGLSFLALFLAAAGTAVGVSLALIRRVYSSVAAAMQDSTVEIQAAASSDIAWIVGAVGVALVVYVASLWDVWRT